jgi:hypothetical protein
MISMLDILFIILNLSKIEALLLNLDALDGLEEKKLNFYL